MSIENEEFFLSPEEVKERNIEKKKREAEHLRLIDDMRWVLSKPQGRRICQWLLELCGVFRGTFVAGGLEGQRATDFNEGGRDKGLAFIQLLHEANPAIVLQMQTEKLAEQMKEKKKEVSNG